MGQTITLTAKDGFKLGAYRADPEGKPRGAIVVIQEIFGVNHHIRSVADRYAALGYVAIAPRCSTAPRRISRPAMTSRAWRRAAASRGKISTETAPRRHPGGDRLRASSSARSQWSAIAWAARSRSSSATRLDGVAGAVGYYGGQIAQVCEREAARPDDAAFRR